MGFSMRPLSVRNSYLEVIYIYRLRPSLSLDIKLKTKDIVSVIIIRIIILIIIIIIIRVILIVAYIHPDAYWHRCYNCFISIEIKGQAYLTPFFIA